MAQALMVYLVPRAQVLGFPGCRDRALLDAIREQMAEDLEQLDWDFETDHPDVWDGPTATQALAELMDGQPTGGGDAAGLYTAVFEVACRYLGEFAGNDWLSRCSVESLDELDQLLAAGGVPLSLYRLWADNPFGPGSVGAELDLGHWPADVMRAGTSPLARLVPTVADPELRGALETVRDWLRMAEAAPDPVLIGFLH